MKKKWIGLGIALIILVSALFFGCSLEKSYYHVYGDICYEIATNNKDSQQTLLNLGYTQGGCPAGTVGACLLADYVVDGQTLSATLYFYSPTYTALSAQAYCLTLGGTSK